MNGSNSGAAGGSGGFGWDWGGWSGDGGLVRTGGIGVRMEDSSAAIRIFGLGG